MSSVRSRPSIVLSLLVLVVSCVCSGSAVADEIPWSKNVRQAINEAGSTGKPVLVDAWANWCGACIQMDKTTYRDASIVEQAKAFVPLKVDKDVQDVFCDKYEVEALPLVLILDGDGREVTRRLGLQSVEALLGVMQAVERGYTSYLLAMDRRDDPQAMWVAASYLLELGNPDGASRVARDALKAAKSAPPEQREPLELLLAESRLDAGEWNAAAKGFERLVDQATQRPVIGAALRGLVRAYRAKGRTSDAERTLERLRDEFPELVQGADLDLL